MFSWGNFFYDILREKYFIIIFAATGLNSISVIIYTHLGSVVCDFAVRADSWSSASSLSLSISMEPFLSPLTRNLYAAVSVIRNLIKSANKLVPIILTLRNINCYRARLSVYTLLILITCHLKSPLTDIIDINSIGKNVLETQN